MGVTSRSAVRLPSYLLHQASGQARARIAGRDYYLGPYGSPESRVKYGQLIATHLGGIAPAVVTQPVDPFASQPASQQAAAVTVNELVLSFMRHATTYYSKHGKPTDEVECFKSAIKPLVELYGFIGVDQFTPLAMKAVREKYVTNGWSRGYCNKSTNRIRHIWRWAVENGMASVVTLQALEAVSPLKAGKCDAPDHKSREAVSDERIEAVRPHLSQQHRDLFDLLRATGARPSELLGLSMADIDTTGDIWIADLTDHKNAHRGLSRKLFFGPKAQAVLKRCPAKGTIFKFTRATFSNAVKRACTAAKVTPFVPYCLRHTKLTELRDDMGVEHAQATGGHAKPDMTAHYSKKMDKLATSAARKAG